MDVVYFLKERTRMIREYYRLSSQPFRDIVRKIDVEEEPLVPGYSEDPEPAFLTEWIEANQMLEVTGRCCLSLLSGSLQMFLSTWERNLGINCYEPFASAFKKRGFVAGYSECFATLPMVEWDSCPADMAIVEQIVLARNRDQHHENLFSFDVAYAKNDLRKYPSPFFLSDDERMHFSGDAESQYLMDPRIHVNAELLDRAIAEVEIFCEWMEHQLFRAKYPNYKMPESST